MSIKVPCQYCIFENSFLGRKSKSFFRWTIDVVNFQFPFPKPYSGKKDVIWAVCCAWSYIALYIIPNVGNNASTFIALARVSSVSGDIGVATLVLCLLQQGNVYIFIMKKLL